MAQLSERQVSDLDLMHYGIFVEGRAHEIWRRLRAEAPVFWNPGNTGLPGFWSITKYADLIAVSRDTETFISSRGITMSFRSISWRDRTWALVGSLKLDTRLTWCFPKASVTAPAGTPHCPRRW